MTTRYVIRTVDRDWIDELDGPIRIDNCTEAWHEAKRRVAAYPETMTVAIDRDTGGILWQSDPDIPAHFELVAADRAGFDPRDPEAHRAHSILSSHKFRDDALTAFYDAIEEPRDDVLIVRDTTPGIHRRVISTSDDFTRLVPA